MRFKCKAIGNLDIHKWASEMHMQKQRATNEELQEDTTGRFELHEYRSPVARAEAEAVSSLRFGDPIIEYNAASGRREWLLRAEDVEYMAIGAGILACSGGGSPHIGKLEVLRCLAASQPVRVVELESLADDEVALMCACYGAPLMMTERLPSAEKLVRAVREMCARFDLSTGHTSNEQREQNEHNETGGKNSVRGRRNLTAFVCAEVGGMNSLEPLLVAALLDLPVLDVDLMGRAFPQLQLCTPFIYGENPLPCALAGDYGDVYVLTEAEVSFY